MTNYKIAIIGGGNLGSSIAEGLIASGFVQANQIILTNAQDSSKSLSISTIN